MLDRTIAFGRDEATASVAENYGPHLAAMMTKPNEWTQYLDMADIIGVVKSA